MTYVEKWMLLKSLGLTLEMLPFISYGNVKVKCPIFNLPSGLTCRKGVECCGYCYAKKAERLYPAVRPCRMRNYRLSKKEEFVRAMYYQLSVILDRKTDKYNKNYCRFQEAGDIYSLEYLNKMYEIVKSFPKVTFYCYTKRTDILTPEVLIERPKNLIMNYSVDGLQKEIPTEIPQGYDNIITTHETKTNCPALLDDSKKCMKDCFKCASPGHSIVFKKH